ncbi:MAG: hypothetical protein ACOC0A_04230, partial [Planctomycetota bacterium]
LSRGQAQIPHLQNLTIPRVFRHDGKRHVAIINHADTEVTASLPWSRGEDVNALIVGNIEQKENGDGYVLGGEAVGLFEIR